MPVLTLEQPPLHGKAPSYLSSPPKLASETTPLCDAKRASTVVRDVEATLSNAYPVVRLDVDAIPEAVASRLAASLLGHVLFLKNQIPFPVMQLGRIPGGKTNSRAAKLRTELMASYDTISSHLDTTFSALATALACCSDSEAHSQAHITILVGPSLGSAKTKVVMGIDGLERRVWAVRRAGARSESVQQDCGEEDEEDDYEEGEETNAEVEDAGSDEEDEELPEDSEDEDDEEENKESEDDDVEEEEDGDEDSVDDGEEDEEDEASKDEQDHNSAPPPPYISYAEEQKFLQSADRLLSRVLAAADAEGNGIASEMSPTQTHVLIRAPRVFKHPAWVPRQNVSGSLDATLAEFLAASGVQSPPDISASVVKKGSAKKNKVEGVWVTTRGGIQVSPEVKAESSDEEGCDKLEREGTAVTDEAAEMIWWSWDGKFVGFSDW